MRPSHGATQRPISARAHGANRVDGRIAFVQRRIGNACSSASFASTACCELANVPRYSLASGGPLGSRTTLSRGNASAVSSFKYAYLRHVLPRRLYLG